MQYEYFIESGIKCLKIYCILTFKKLYTILKIFNLFYLFHNSNYYKNLAYFEVKSRIRLFTHLKTQKINQNKHLINNILNH